MRASRLHQWIFLGYWVLLLNLGPVLHRAHTNGVHVHHSACSHEHHEQVCDSGHHHSHHGHGHFHGEYFHIHACDRQHGEDLASTESPENFLHSEHDCSLCDFFESYNVVIDAEFIEVASTPIQLKLPGYAQPDHPHCLKASARGPPQTLVLA